MILGLCVIVDESMRRQFPVTLQLSVIGKTGCEAKSATERNKNYSRYSALVLGISKYSILFFTDLYHDAPIA